MSDRKYYLVTVNESLNKDSKLVLADSLFIEDGCLVFMGVDEISRNKHLVVSIAKGTWISVILCDSKGKSEFII